ncbi:MAG: ABC transporter substrate-binding protein [Chloroflexi bacterium]|nr:ABC transporter substrate-binding protein [Chloroflexota bacterium]
MRAKGLIICWCSIALALVAGCAAPAPTASSTQPAAVAPTPTKAPTATATKRPLTKVTFGISQIGSNDVSLLLAIHRFSKDEGLDVDIFHSGSGSKTRTAIIAGDVQFGSSNIEQVIRAVAKDAPLVAIAANDYGSGVIVVLDKGIADKREVNEKSPLADRMKALAGLRFAITGAGSQTDAQIRAILLRYGGLTPDRDVEIIYVGDVAQQVAALEAGAVDGFVAEPPTALVPVVKGKAITLANIGGPEFPEYSATMGSGIATNPQWASANPEAATAMVRALWRALKLIWEDPVTAKDVAHKVGFSELDRGLFDLSFDATWHVFPKDPTIRESATRPVIDRINELLPPEDRINLSFEQYATNRFVEEAKRQLGF